MLCHHIPILLALLHWLEGFLLTLLANRIWVLFLTNGFRLSILWGLVPYVTSDFQSHSLLSVISIVSDSMTAAVYIPMAKLLNVWGRAEGFALMVGFSTLGLILMAVSQNLATFCAAQVSLRPRDPGFSHLMHRWLRILPINRSSTPLDLPVSSTLFVCWPLMQQTSEIVVLHLPLLHLHT